MTWRYLAGAAAVTAAVLLYFAGFSAGITLAAAVIMLGLVPGYALAHFLLKDLGELEKVILGFFLGLPSTGLVLYYLNVLGLESVSPVFSYGVGILALAALLFTRFKSGPRQDS